MADICPDRVHSAADHVGRTGRCISPADRLLDALRTARAPEGESAGEGLRHVSQRALASTLGVSRKVVARMLAELAGQGVIRLSAGPRGTRVALLVWADEGDVFAGLAG